MRNVSRAGLMSVHGAHPLATSVFTMALLSFLVLECVFFRRVCCKRGKLNCCTFSICRLKLYFFIFFLKMFRGSIVRSATIEEIEAEKSSIETDVVSLFFMVD